MPGRRKFPVLILPHYSRRRGMSHDSRLLVRACLFVLAGWLLLVPTVFAGPKMESYWQVDDVRAGMKGTGRTVIKGTKIESFAAEVLGVMRNTNPGRDMILCRLSGL